jgi:pantoate--beta-alanine ligase
MMIFDNQVTLRAYLKTAHDNKSTVGFVPTMGALHQGHLSLMEEALKNNNLCVVSIFVNPTQFNNLEDLEKYPRTLESDVEKIKTLNDQIIIYAPTVSDIYQESTSSEHFNFDGLEHQMEGAFRVGHFDGVGTIVKRLFEIVKPTNSYFGEKDFQQLQIVKKLVEKHQIPVNIVGCAIYRENNGLAMSSRNERLSANERNEAALIYQTLQAAKEQFGTKNAGSVTEWVESVFENQSNFKLEYFQIADEATLLPCLEKEPNKKYRAFIAVFANNIRLIDTISLN